MRHAFLLLILMLAIGASASAQKLPKIEFEKYTLANGLDVILSVNKSIPAVNVNLWYHVGSKNEVAGKTGFAHLFEHMMFQGSKHVVGEYLSLVEQAGANLRTGGVNGTTSNDRTNYFETVPTSSLEYALWLESDRMGFLDDALTNEKFTNQQDVVKNEKRQGDNAPYAAVQYMVAENLYPVGHPYAHTVIGSIDDLTNATLDDVREFFNTWYVPNNCTLTLVGDFDPSEAKELIEKYFGPFAPGKPQARPGVNIPYLERNKQVVAKDRVPQARLQFVYPVPQMYSREEAELDFAASILGQGKTSYLYKKLVRELQLASNVMVYNAAREISGEFTIIVTARPGADVDKIRTVVDEQIAAFVSAGPTREEMQRITSETEVNFLSSLERIGGFGGIADKLGGYNTFIGTPDYFQQDYDRYLSVTPEAVTNSFRKWVADAHRLEVLVTPETSGRPEAQEFDRTEVPSMEGSISFTAPQTESRTLSNGLEVVVSQRAGLPLISTRLMIKTQDVLESEDKAGRSSMTANMLDEGTHSRSALRIQEELDKYGSSLRVGGGKQGATVTLGSMSKFLDPSFELLADIVLNPAFDEDEFAQQRKQALDGLKRNRSNPGSVANQVYMKKLFGADHPLGRSSEGTETSISALSTADLRETWTKFWVPNNASLLFVGDITLDDAVKLAEKYLGDWSQAKLPDVNLPKWSKSPGKTIYLVDRQGAPQSEIRIGSAAPNRMSPDYYAIQMTNTLLGGAFSSRLNLNLREDKGYTYGAFCRINMEREYGYWMATAGVQTKVTKESVIEFRKEIEGIGGGIPVRPEELRNMQNNLTRGYVQNFESNDMIAGQIAPLLTDGLPISTLTEYLPSIESQTPAAVTATAQKYYRFDDAIMVVVGDLSEIEAPLRALNWGTVIIVDEDGNEK
ncbi:MAG: pitrilysin family protein [Bacteroidota bacterium]